MADVEPDQTSMRADAQRNREAILNVARTMVGNHGTEMSLRAIARNAGVGLGTLYRHFPTRDDLLQEILRSSFDELAEKARISATSEKPLDALEKWMEEVAASTSAYQGLAASMVEKRKDPTSSLHASCSSLKQSSDALVRRAQEAKLLRSDIEGVDIMSLVSAIAWLSDLEEFTPGRRKRLLDLLMEGLRA